MKKSSIGKTPKWIKKAETLYKNGDIDSAIELLESLSDKEKKIYLYKSMLSSFLIEKKRYSEAEKICFDIIDSHPEDAKTLFNIANIYLKSGMNNKAFIIASKLLEKHPTSHASHVTYASVMQRQGHLSEAVHHYKEALKLQNVNWGSKKKKKKEDFNRPEVEALMWHTLEMFASAGVHAFPTAGTLLGLVREGGLLPHDKDIDFSLPFSEMTKADRLLKKRGWKRVPHSIIPLINPIAYYNEEVKVSLDLFGVSVEKESRKYITGFWMKGIPKEWNRITEIPEFNLIKVDTPQGGRCWYPKFPESIVSRLYGKNWKIPDPNFESVISGGHVRGFSLLTQCYAYQKLYGFIGNGQAEKAKNIAASIKHKSRNSSLTEICDRILLSN